MAVKKWSTLKLGNGRLVHVTNDPWLSRPSTFKLVQQPCSLGCQTVVAQLMNDDGASWNEELIKEEFCGTDATLVLGISIQGNNVEDILIWHYTTNDRFSVKSTYDLAL
ncbi:UNVERIFIED_CONTAM: hypothetical protein Slati_0006300 [Sesamum latifolium]|uniref:Uncharacterized protein n=1 Tax=Sesamum latifolium TaxID=2727402 RepID=A0AAW2Y5W1_9LAMI